ncbi:MAG TPA: GNAT family N-acetyltransferase [Streptosporangiaceae bacterium]
MPEIRLLRADDDLDAEIDLSRRAFGPVSQDSTSARLASVRGSIAAGAMLGAFDGERLVGSARYHRMHQWWHGRGMPMAGVAGVKVAPEERGRGVGRAMMAALLRQIAAEGFPVSVLYPATVPLYREAGWEIAGGQYETVLPSRLLTTIAAGTPADGERRDLRRATPADAQAVAAVLDLVHAQSRHCGPSTREPWELRDWLDDPEHFAYLADDGFLSYRWGSHADPIFGVDEVEVDHLVAASPATARAFWRILASHATIAGRVRAWLAPDDPVQWLTRDWDGHMDRFTVWMLRIVDAPAAIAARGFPASATLSVPLELTDEVLPANTGHWRLEIAGGAGRLERAAPDRSDALRLGAGGLAALFAGASLPGLRLAGLAEGGNAAVDDALAGAFSCTPFMLDNF